MAGVSLENWVERIRDPKIECMSRDEMAAFLLGKAAGILFLPVKIIVNSISKRLKKLVRSWLKL